MNRERERETIGDEIRIAAHGSRPSCGRCAHDYGRRGRELAGAAARGPEAACCSAGVLHRTTLEGGALGGLPGRGHGSAARLHTRQSAGWVKTRVLGRFNRVRNLRIASSCGPRAADEIVVSSQLRRLEFGYNFWL
jgi:hypothetical protein